jgi:predicted RNA-binding protein associated with RNAse of E/G family
MDRTGEGGRHAGDPVDDRRAGRRLIDAATAERALRVLYLAVEGLGRHHYALDAWLAILGVSLTWCPAEPAGPA